MRDDPMRAAEAKELFARALAAQQQRRDEVALRLYEQAVRVDPHFAAAHNNRGVILDEIGRTRDAISSFSAAISADRGLVDAHHNLGVSLARLGEHKFAILAFDAALASGAERAATYAGLGGALRAVGEHEQAIAAYERALVLDASLPQIAGMRVLSKLEICEWRDHDEDVSRVAREILEGRMAAPPLALLCCMDSPQLQYTASRLATASMPGPLQSDSGERGAEDRIRVAYFSADFREHPLMNLLAGVFEGHDRNRFELFAFSLGPAGSDQVTERVKPAFDEFFDVRDLGHDDVVRLARSSGIDVAVDLGGHTLNNRMEIFARRVAPVQAAFLGYAGTSGLDAMDYVIADSVVIPAEQRRWYSEAVVSLPCCCQPASSIPALADAPPDRAALSLPRDAFVFCAFHGYQKIGPLVFDAWMQILRGVPSSVLWLRDFGATGRRNLESQARERGIDPARLVFAREAPREEHLLRHRGADLFLDSYPYNGHATANDAICMGVPVLTLAGHGFASRVGASLLQGPGIEELIADRLETYVASAVRLGRSPALCDSLRRAVAANRAGRLFPPQRFARALELSFEAMLARCRAGLKPESFDVAEEVGGW